MNKQLAKLACAVLAASLSAPLALADNTTGQFNSDQVKAIQTIVHDYLVSNPQVLVEVSEALQQQELAKIEEKAQTAITSNAKDIFNNPASPVAGNPNGNVTLVEFFDYQCPHCKEMAPVIEKLQKQDSNLRIVFKELPIFGGNSQEAAKAALAAYQQGAANYLKFHNALMAADNPLTPDKIMQIAKDSGLDINKLKKDMQSTAIDDQLKDNFRLAQEIGILGTPSFVLGNQQASQAGNSSFIPGATSEGNLQNAIAKLRQSS